MSWWSKHRGSKHPEGAPADPVSLDIVLGKLQVTVYTHDIEHQHEMIPCWSYLTDGLWNFGHKEIIFTLRRNEDETSAVLPGEPLQALASILSYAEKARTVDAGDLSEF